MLTGKAKTDYQREYMRKKRAGEPTAKPKSPPAERITYSMVSDIEHWIKYPRRVKQAQRNITKGLTLALPEMPANDGSIEQWSRLFPAHKQDVLNHVSTDPAWQEALRRYRAHKDALKAKRLKRKAGGPRIRYCVLCSEPASPDRLMFGDDVWVVCEQCVAQAAAAFAEARRQQQQT